jgi:thymidylate synthase
MSKFDEIYERMCKDIIKYGYSDEGEDVRTVWKDGTKAHTQSLLNYPIRLDNSEVPILTSKFVAWKTAIKELLWIWQYKSNSVNTLNAMGVKIWDEWKKSDGTVGKSYGYQLGKRVFKKSGQLFGGIGNRIVLDCTYKVDQVDYLLENLKTNPSSRRHITTLWSIEDLDDMALTPCVWATHWQVQGKKLHLTVLCRSNDICLGNPFNVFQYYVLQRMIAQVSGYEVGTLTFNIDNAHIYTRHFMPVLEQLDRPTYEAPTLIINPEVKNFYDFTIDDFKLVDYKHSGKIDFEVAI